MVEDVVVRTRSVGMPNGEFVTITLMQSDIDHLAGIVEQIPECVEKIVKHKASIDPSQISSKGPPPYFNEIKILAEDRLGDKWIVFQNLVVFEVVKKIFEDRK